MIETPVLALPKSDLPAAGEADLWLLSLDAPQWPLGELERILDRAERERADRFHFAQHRRQFVTSHGQLRMVLASYLETAPGEVAIVQPEGGKPRLAMSTAPFDFNLSHSDALALVGISCHPIGVDIEALRIVSDRDEIVRQNFASAEVAALAALPADRQCDGFFACWTRKEAYVKALGLGLAEPLDRFVVSTDPDAPAAMLRIDGSSERAAQWSLWAASAAPAYWAAAAVAHPGVRFRMRSLS